MRIALKIEKKIYMNGRRSMMKELYEVKKNVKRFENVFLMNKIFVVVLFL